MLLVETLPCGEFASRAGVAGLMLEGGLLQGQHLIGGHRLVRLQHRNILIEDHGLGRAVLGCLELLGYVW